MLKKTMLSLVTVLLITVYVPKSSSIKELLSVLMNGSITVSTQESKRIAVVIDDFGNKMDGTKEMLELEIPFTVAVMPFLPSSKEDAEQAHKSGREVIVHMPMEPMKGKKEWLGPGAILVNMTDEEIRSTVERAFDNVPHAAGMNNHMGSKATADKRVMRIVLEVCKERGMFFLDSRTTPKSVVPQLATEIGVPYLQNQVFLDDIYRAEHVEKQMMKLNKVIDNNSVCITIGHVGPPGKITSAVLKRHIPKLSQKAQFVKLSELIELPDLISGPAVLQNP